MDFIVNSSLLFPPIYFPFSCYARFCSLTCSWFLAFAYVFFLYILLLSFLVFLLFLVGSSLPNFILGHIHYSVHSLLFPMLNTLFLLILATTSCYFILRCASQIVQCFSLYQLVLLLSLPLGFISGCLYLHRQYLSHT